MTPQPPRLAQWLLGRMLPADFRDPCLGDLEQRYLEEILPTRGAAAANRWYWRETIAAPLALLHLPRRRPLPGDSWMTLLFADLRYAIRTLRNRPAFTALTVLILALGIGATTAIFSAVYPILFDALPYPVANQLTMIWELQKDGTRDNLGYATFADIRDRAKSYDVVAAVGGFNGTITGGDAPERLIGQKVSSSFFRVIGVSPAIGRGFSADEDRPGAPRAIILTDALWRRRFGGETSILGKSITIDGNQYVVVGVMPAGFENVLNPAAQLFVPLRYDVSLPYACRGCHHLRAVGRLRNGVDPVQAATELKSIYATMRREHPTDYSATTLLPVRLQEDITRAARPVLLAVLGAVALLLLISCANVTNLLLGRAAQRRGEFALRAALGASRGRVVRQLVTESVLLAGIGGVLGVVFAVFGVQALVALSPAQMPRLSAIAVNQSVLWFALVLSLVIGVGFGVLPALHASRRDLQQGIHSASRRTAGGSGVTRGVLVVAEVALALVLLIGSGLMLRSVTRLLRVEPGFNAEQLLTVQIQSGGVRMSSDTLTWRYFDRVLAAVRALPGVSAAALTSQLPLSNDFDGYGIHSERHPNVNPSDDPSAFRHGVSAGYLETMQIPLRRGRLLTPEDGLGQPEVVVINESFAQRFWKGEDPIGQRIRMGDPSNGPWRTIVGVVGDVKQLSLAAENTDAIYHPEVQSPYGADNAMTIVVRGNGDVSALLPAIRQTVTAIDPDQPIVRVATMSSLLEANAAQRRFALILFEVFAGVALLLAGAGIYGVLNGMVNERLREIGVRSALGATTRDILGLVVGTGMRLTLIGLGVGVLAAVLLGRTISSLLFGVPPVDLLTYAGVAFLLAGVAAIACIAPARRAVLVDPVVTLRAD